MINFRLSIKKQIQALQRVHDPFKMKAQIRLKEDEFWSKRAELIKLEQQDYLASEGSPPLRSEQPSEATNKPQTQEAL